MENQIYKKGLMVGLEKVYWTKVHAIIGAPRPQDKSGGN
jgi:hypothetical protein